MAKRPDRPKRNVRGRPRPSADARKSKAAVPSMDYGEMPENDEKTTWVPSTESMDPGELTSWISGKSDQPDFERTESARSRRPPLTPDPKAFGNVGDYEKYEATGVVHTPIKKRRAPSPEPSPRRKGRISKALPTPEPAPRRRTKRANRIQPTPSPRPPKPPTPEPAPPRRGRRAAVADDEPSLTVPRPGHTPAPAPPRHSSIPRPAAPPVPLPPVPLPPTPQAPVPDNWTPAPSGDHVRNPPRAISQGFDANGFPVQPDVPSTVVSEDSIDEVPPTGVPVPPLLNDAPTIVRPDLSRLADMMASVDGTPVSSQDETVGTDLQPLAGSTAAAMRAYEEQPPGEPTVALPPPSKRKNTSVRQPTPEPSPDALPNGASYSPPPEQKKARSVNKPPPTSSNRSSAPKKKSGRSKSSKKLPKNATVSNDSEGSSNLYYVYGGITVLGLLLVAGAFILGLIILAATAT